MLQQSSFIYATTNPIAAAGFCLIAYFGCSSAGNNAVGAIDSQTHDTMADSHGAPDGMFGDTSSANDLLSGDVSQSGFLTNPAFCSAQGGFRSAVAAVAVAQPQELSAFAEELVANGYSVVHHLPDSPTTPEDVVATPDVISNVPDGGDSVTAPEDTASPAPDGTSSGDGETDSGEVPIDAGIIADITPDTGSGEPVWPGEDVWGEYVVMVSPLGDVTYLLSNGDMVVASACPMESLGQVRRLDFALANAIQVLSKVQGTDYAEETRRWAMPTAYYSDRAGTYWREYFNESLDLNKVQSGVLSCSTTPNAAAFGVYGHADTPSIVGDVIGVESLVVGGVTIAEDQKQTSNGEVALVWNLMPHIGAGEVAWSVDMLVSDASVGFNVGKYYPFIDALFPSDKQAALIVNIQGTLPGPNRTSRAIAELTLPPAPSR